MAKAGKLAEPHDPRELLFQLTQERKRRHLILPRLLESHGETAWLRDEQQDQAHAIILRWADLERDGHLNRKETSIDADFMREVFGDALGYRLQTESPDEFEQTRNFTVEGIGTADGALGNFRASAPLAPLAVIELKAASVHLDRDRISGRTPVQQCWDYLNALAECPWGIVSNFSIFRLYHRNRTPLAYEEFLLQDLRDRRRFNQFYYLFERGGLVRPRTGYQLRSLALVEESEQRQRAVGDELYDAYAANRYRLIEHLHFQHGKSLERAIDIAQKLLDRIIFIAFCEDRELLPAKCLERAGRTVTPFSRVTNPRWRNFLDLFHAVDRGHEEMLALPTGYNGGLFRHDPEVDDLQLTDDWTNFFVGVGGYDFRDEVNVEVLGHFFERSISEIERLRTGGLFAEEFRPVKTINGAQMPKSAERKRLGTYYTPPDFTQFLVQHTVGVTVEERLAAVRQRHGLTLESLENDKPNKTLAAYWTDALAALRDVKVCDPACGSGAFLIPAYDLLADAYTQIVDQLIFHGVKGADEFIGQISDWILSDNLFGVDLSPQAVEIAQLALWIRSAKKGKTLADLSHNIVLGNSLVSDRTIDPLALDWRAAFPHVFDRKENAGFDGVIGNPPWERMKVQEREFFSFSAPKIAAAVSAAQRRAMIGALENQEPDLFARYEQALARAEQAMSHLRQRGDYPLTGKGDLNTYMLFAELARRIVAPRGRVGLLVPSGIATDHTTREFFADLIDREALVSLHDYENKAAHFPDVHRSFKFSTLVFGGAEVRTTNADFVFFARLMEDIEDDQRHIKLTKKDFALLNPNTRTCPIFRTRRDAELTKAVYKRVPILIDHSRKKSGGNPWGVRFVRMFDQTNDAELFHTAEQVKKLGFKRQNGWWKKGKETYLPLYEAKMIQAYDHRAAGVVLAGHNWMRQGQPEATTLVQHQNPEYVAEPRWWVDQDEVARVMGETPSWGCLCYKDVTSATNQRTMIAALIPLAGVLNSAPLVLPGEEITPRLQACLLANLNALALDFVARQKVGGMHLNFFIVEQFPICGPDFYADKCPWHKRQTLERWISERVLKLTCTAEDMRPLAEAARFEPPIYPWNPRERAELTAELDAAYFLLYALARKDIEYILSTFQGLDEETSVAGVALRMDELVLQTYDRLAAAR